MSLPDLKSEIQIGEDLFGVTKTPAEGIWVIMDDEDNFALLAKFNNKWYWYIPTGEKVTDINLNGNAKLDKTYFPGDIFIVNGVEYVVSEQLVGYHINRNDPPTLIFSDDVFDVYQEIEVNPVRKDKTYLVGNKSFDLSMNEIDLIIRTLKSPNDLNTTSLVTRYASQLLNYMDLLRKDLEENSVKRTSLITGLKYTMGGCYANNDAMHHITLDKQYYSCSDSYMLNTEIYQPIVQEAYDRMIKRAEIYGEQNVKGFLLTGKLNSNVKDVYHEEPATIIYPERDAEINFPIGPSNSNSFMLEMVALDLWGYGRARAQFIKENWDYYMDIATGLHNKTMDDLKKEGILNRDNILDMITFISHLECLVVVPVINVPDDLIQKILQKTKAKKSALPEGIDPNGISATIAMKIIKETFPLMNGTGFFGYNSFLRAYFEGISLVGVPDRLRDIHLNEYQCILKFESHDLNHIMIAAEVDKKEIEKTKKIYNYILNSDVEQRTKEFLVLYIFSCIHEFGITPLGYKGVPEENILEYDFDEGPFLFTEDVRDELIKYADIFAEVLSLPIYHEIIAKYNIKDNGIEIKPYEKTESGFKGENDDLIWFRYHIWGTYLMNKLADLIL